MGRIINDTEIVVPAKPEKKYADLYLVSFTLSTDVHVTPATRTITAQFAPYNFDTKELYLPADHFAFHDFYQTLSTVNVSSEVLRSTLFAEVIEKISKYAGLKLQEEKVDKEIMQITIDFMDKDGKLPKDKKDKADALKVKLDSIKLGLGVT